MQSFNSSPASMLTSILNNKSLIRALILREITGRYKGSIFGLFWSFITPLFMLLVYTFFFSVVFKARWSGGSDSKSEFALVLFAGLLLFNLFSECVNRAPGLILSNPNYVKKIVFPLRSSRSYRSAPRYFTALSALWSGCFFISCCLAFHR